MLLTFWLSDFFNNEGFVFDDDEGCGLGDEEDFSCADEDFGNKLPPLFLRDDSVEVTKVEGCCCNKNSLLTS